MLRTHFADTKKDIGAGLKGIYKYKTLKGE
jgi:hypothetical protein